MKKFAKIFVLTMAVLAVTMLFAACSSKPLDISISESNMPQTTFVQGNDLDLSKGALTVKTKDGVERVSLTDSGVSVKGYDKNRLGEQELIVSYGGKTTTLVVTVVPRISAENYERNYFIGEKFSQNSGRLRVYRDDGTSYTVSLKDESVKVSEMDSSKSIQPIYVDVTYKPDSATEYKGTIEVNIYEVSSAVMKNPNKLSYKSHENTLDVSGGYITFKSEGGEITRSVMLSDESVTITGFDPGAATVANRTQELSQDITVKCLGREFGYKIGIKYSDVSLIKDCLEELKDVVLEEDGFNLTYALGQKGFEAVKMYMELSAADAAYITDEEATRLIRVATYYGADLWMSEFNKYNKAFTIYNGTLTAVCATYQDTKSAYEQLVKYDNALIAVTNVLTQMKTKYPDVVMFTGSEDSKDMTLGDYLKIVPTSAELDAMVGQFEYMLDLYDELEVIPENWKDSDPQLKNATYDAAVNGAVSIIKSNFSKYSSRSVYALLVGWRADYFDIIYTNCYYNNKTSSINTVKDCYLPYKLEDLYEQLVMAYNQVYYMNFAVNTGYVLVAETTNYMWYMRNAAKLMNEIATSEDEMVVDLFNTLTFTEFTSIGLKLYSIYSVLLNVDYGYVYHMGAMLDDENFDALWDAYLDLYDEYQAAADKSAFMQSNAFANEAMDLFEMFVNLNPSEQFSFIMSVNYIYGAYPTLAFEYSTSGCHSYFAMFLINGLYVKLGQTEEALDLVDAVLYTIEYYARYTVTSFGPQTANKLADYISFRDNMNIVEENAALLKSESALNVFYTKYSAIRKIYGSGPMSETEVEYTEEEQAMLDAFKDLYTDAVLAYNYIAKTSVNTVGLLIAAYEKWQQLEAEILSSGNTKLIESYLYRSYVMTGEFGMPLSYYFLYTMRALFINVGLNVTISNTPVYTLYSMADDKEALSDFFATAYPVMSTAFHNLLAKADKDDETVPSEYKQEEITAALKAYYELSETNIVIYKLLTTNFDIFTEGVLEHYESILEEDEFAALETLFTVINAYALCEFYKDTDNAQSAKKSLETYYEKLKSAYEALDSSAQFDTYFKTIYDDLIAKCKTVLGI